MRRNLLSRNYLMLDTNSDIVRPVVSSSIPRDLLESLSNMRKTFIKYESKNREKINELAIDENNFHNQQLLNFFLKRECQPTIISPEMLINALNYSMAVKDRYEERVLRYMYDTRFLENQENPLEGLDPDIVRYIVKYGYYSYKTNSVTMFDKEKEIYLYNAGAIRKQEIDIPGELEKLRLHKEDSEKLYREDDMKNLIYTNTEQKK